MVEPSKSRAIDRSGPIPEPLKRFQQFLALCRITPEQFRGETGFSRSRIDQWFWRDEPIIPQRSWPEILQVADRHGVTGLTLDWLNLGVGDEPALQEARDLPRNDVVEIPGRVPDGLRRLVYLEDFMGSDTYRDIPASLLRKKPELLEPYIRVVENFGDSMRGEIEDGDICFVDTRVDSFKAPAIYAFQMGEFALVQRITVYGPGVLRIQGTKPHEDSFQVNEEERKFLRIRGRVIHVISGRDL